MVTKTFTTYKMRAVTTGLMGDFDELDISEGFNVEPSKGAVISADGTKAIISAVAQSDWDTHSAHFSSPDWIEE